MGKKAGAIIIISVLVTALTFNVYAGNTDGLGNTTSPAISNAQQSVTSSGINTTSSGVTTKSGNTSESAISNSAKNSTAPKSDVEATLQNIMQTGKAIDNGEPIMKITSPDQEKDSTYKKSYILSGNSEHKDVTIFIAKYSETTGKYEKMKNTDGETSWEINSTGLFSKEILLTKGTNKIMILASRSSQKDESDWQVNCFTIELLDESIAERVVRKTAEIGTSVGKLMDLLSGRTK